MLMKEKYRKKLKGAMQIWGFSKDVNRRLADWVGRNLRDIPYVPFTALLNKHPCVLPEMYSLRNRIGCPPVVFMGAPTELRKDLCAKIKSTLDISHSICFGVDQPPLYGMMLNEAIRCAKVGISIPQFMDSLDSCFSLA